MLVPRSIVAFKDIIAEEGFILQRGMNYRIKPGYSIVLMSLRPNAPYTDKVENEGRVLIYEGHDTPRIAGGKDPKSIDQPLTTPLGKPTQNGLFMSAASEYKNGKRSAELVRVYEKIKSGIWVFNGVFRLIDAWLESSGKRKVCKFRLELNIDDQGKTVVSSVPLRSNDRIIPSSVKQDVYKRDGGRCRICGNNKNLHFDHDIPFVLGGSSITAENVQLLCADCNLKKKDKIQ